MFTARLRDGPRPGRRPARNRTRPSSGGSSSSTCRRRLPGNEASGRYRGSDDRRDVVGAAHRPGSRRWAAGRTLLVALLLAHLLLKLALLPRALDAPLQGDEVAYFDAAKALSNLRGTWSASARRTTPSWRTTWWATAGSCQGWPSCSAPPRWCSRTRTPARARLPRARDPGAVRAGPQVGGPHLRPSLDAGAPGGTGPGPDVGALLLHRLGRPRAGLVAVLLVCRVTEAGRDLVAGEAPGRADRCAIGALAAAVLYLRSSTFPLVLGMLVLLALGARCWRAAAAGPGGPGRGGRGASSRSSWHRGRSRRAPPSTGGSLTTSTVPISTAWPSGTSTSSASAVRREQRLVRQRALLAHRRASHGHERARRPAPDVRPRPPRPPRQRRRRRAGQPGPLRAAPRAASSRSSGRSRGRRRTRCPGRSPCLPMGYFAALLVAAALSSCRPPPRPTCCSAACSSSSGSWRCSPSRSCTSARPATGRYFEPLLTLLGGVARSPTRGGPRGAPPRPAAMGRPAAHVAVGVGVSGLAALLALPARGTS